MRFGAAITAISKILTDTYGRLLGTLTLQLLMPKRCRRIARG